MSTGMFAPTGAGGSGSGTGAKNYLSSYNGNVGNGDFEFGSVTGFSLFNTTLTSLIPTGSITAGAASVTTFNTVSSGQLAALYSLQTASSGAWSAGQGFISDAFTIDIEDQAKPFTFKVYYKAVTNPANANFSGTSSNTFAVYFYDVTNSAWIQPAGVYGMTQNSGVGYVTGTFQTTSNSTQYRMAIIAVNASAGALTMYWDDLFVGPQTAPLGYSGTDPVAYTPTFTNFGTVTGINVKSCKVGKYLFIEGTATTGTTAAGEARISLGYGGANSNVTSASSLPTLSVVGEVAQSATSVNDIKVLIEPSKSYLTFGLQAAGNAGLAKANGSTILGNTVTFSFFAMVEIEGWSSNVQTSNDTDTRIVDFVGTNSGTQAVTANVTNITFATTVKDSHASYSSGIYTIPVSGDYQIFFTSGSSGGGLNFAVYVGGSLSRTFMYATSSGNSASGGTIIPNLRAGDQLSIRGDTSLTLNANTQLSLCRISGPAVIAATETMVATITGNPATATSGNPLIYPTVTSDSHGTYSAATGRYTCAVSGHFQMSFAIIATISNGLSFTIYKNAAANIVIGYAYNDRAQGTGIVRCLAGDIIDIRPNGTVTSPSGGANSLSILRVGNY